MFGNLDFDWLSKFVLCFPDLLSPINIFLWKLFYLNRANSENNVFSVSRCLILNFKMHNYIKKRFKHLEI